MRSVYDTAVDDICALGHAYLEISIVLDTLYLVGL